MNKRLQETYRRHCILLTLSLLLSLASCLEETQPEIFLSPRNFNPHPYVASYNPRDPTGATNNRGPVVFPPTEDSAINSNFISLGRNRELKHPVDNHPYSKVARKNKHRFPGRFSNQDNRINPGVYEALSRHGAKVLSEPPSRLGKDYTPSSLPNPYQKNYAFSYKVVDHLTGDDFSHTQSQNSQATNGEYRVKLPDGRVQIVSYVADKNGYKADVKYTENELSSPNIQIRSKGEIPKTTNSHDFQYVKGSHLDAYEGILYAPTEQSKLSQDYGAYIVDATPKPPLYLKSVVPKVEIYTNEINRLDNYIASTVSPFILENEKLYPVVVSSTEAPEYSPVYVTTSKYNPVQNQHQHAELVYGR